MASGSLTRNTTLTDSATKTECHNLIDTATGSLSGIVNANVDAAAAIVDTKLAAIVTSGKVNTTALTTTSKAAGDILYSPDGVTFDRLAIGASGQKLRRGVVLDLMEYVDNAAAQAAYVTDSAEAVDQSNTTSNGGYLLGDSGGNEYREGQSFKLSKTMIITAVEVGTRAVTGSPTGDWTLRIETDNAGVPSGTLANANASIVVTPPGAGSKVKGTFASSFVLVGATTYWIVVNCDNQSADQNWSVEANSSSVYADGNMAQSANGSWTAYSDFELWFKVYGRFLQCFSEATIKTQGTYALKAVAAITDSLNKTLTKTFASPLNLSGINTLELDMRSSRTGANIKLGIHDTGGTTTELTPTIATADTFQEVTVDLSAVSDANKDAIDTFVITPTNADAANTFFVDNFRVTEPILAWVTP